MSFDGRFLREIWADKWVRLVGLLAGLAAVGWFLYRIRSILTALAVAWVLAYICDPLVDRLERRRIPRTVGVALIAVGLVAAFIVVDLVVVPAVVHELARLTQDLPDYLDKLTSDWLPQVERSLNIHLPRTDADFRKFFLANRDSINKVLEAVYSPVTNFLHGAVSGALDFITKLLTLIVVPVAWFFLTRDIDRLHAGIVSLTPMRWREPFVEFMRQVDEIVSNFLRGQITVALILATLYSIGLWLIVDVPLGLLIGVCAGLCSIVPYMGLVVGAVPALALAALQHQDWQHPLGVIAVFAVAQAAEGNFITPRIVGDKLGLHPVTVIFALLIWAQIAGFLGMVIAVPATAVLQVLARRAIARYRAGAFYQDGAAG